MERKLDELKRYKEAKPGGKSGVKFTFVFP